MICRRCGRPLRDPQSVARRYGPTCWKKVRVEDERDYQDWLTEHTTITDAGTAAETIREIWKRVLAQTSDRTCSCGEPLESSDLLTFDHGDGARLKGFGQPQWVFLRCPECQHELTYGKLGAASLDDLAPPPVPVPDTTPAPPGHQDTIVEEPDRGSQ